jgi:hypothetical protein
MDAEETILVMLALRFAGYPRRRSIHFTDSR